MMSLSKAFLIALYSSALTAVVYGERTPLSQGSGAGGGSTGTSGGTSNDYASNTGVSTTTTVSTGASSSSSGSTTTTVSTGASSSNSDQTNDGENTGNVSVSTTTSNVGSSANYDRDQQTISNLHNADNGNSHPGDPNWSDEPQFIGTWGTLAQRTEDVLCPICDAVPTKFYTENLMIAVGVNTWACGYLQETVQDVDQYSFYDLDRQLCRQSQIHAEEGGCCEKTMYINTPGELLNEPCDLCGEWDVPPENRDKLVNTHVVGRHTCGGLEFTMQYGLFSANMCPTITANIHEECCQFDLSLLARAVPEQDPRPLSLLRGGVVP